MSNSSSCRMRTRNEALNRLKLPVMYFAFSGGSMKRTKTGSLTFQIQQKFTDMLAIGESKFLDKKADRTQEKIYSWSTYRTYLKHSNYFIKWAKENYGIKTLDQAKPYINQYLELREKQGLSSFTLKLERSALAKCYQMDSKELYQTKSRLRADIVRSRGVRVRDRHFSEEKNRDFVEFCKGTGLRRAEISQIRGNALKNINGQYFLHVTTATKGGRERTVEITGNIEKIVDMLEKSGENKVFAKVPNGADIHSYRADYCKAIYKKYARPIEFLKKNEIYKCIKDRNDSFDREAMKIASENLGHSRETVIAGHYLLGD